MTSLLEEVENDFSLTDGKSCFSCLNDFDGNQPKQALNNAQGRQRHHGEPSEIKELHNVMASEFSKLSVQERSKALDDIHCVGEELRETPELIEQALKEFEEMVQTLATPTYKIALAQNRSYVEDRQFRLKFLRSKRFNIRKSVQKMMAFLQQKALYFGEEKLTKDIVPGDLGAEEVALMQTGFYQTLKDKDRSGRVVLYISSYDRMPPDCTIETLCRFYYYIIYNVVLSVPSVEKNGAVIIYNDESKGDNSRFPGFQFLTKAVSFFNTLPIRAASLHVCLYSSPGSLSLYNTFGQLCFKIFEDLASRARLHFGSDMERQYQLKGYGILLRNFPVDKNGNIRTDIHEAWCDEYLRNILSRMVQTQQVPSSEPNEAAPHNNNNKSNNVATRSSCAIRQTDVLLGRGRTLQHHPGNVRFRKFLSELSEDYECLSRHDRVAARITYTQQLLSFGVRFLRQDKDNSDVWVVCDFHEAETKVSQFFRTRRRDKKRS